MFVYLLTIKIIGKFISSIGIIVGLIGKLIVEEFIKETKKVFKFKTFWGQTIKKLKPRAITKWAC